MFPSGSPETQWIFLRYGNNAAEGDCWQAPGLEFCLAHHKGQLNWRDLCQAIQRVRRTLATAALPRGVRGPVDRPLLAIAFLKKFLALTWPVPAIWRFTNRLRNSRCDVLIGQGVTRARDASDNSGKIAGFVFNRAVMLEVNLLAEVSPPASSLIVGDGRPALAIVSLKTAVGSKVVFSPRSP